LDDARNGVGARFCPHAQHSGFMNGAGRGTLPPGDPHGFQLTRSYAFGKADVIVIVGTPFDFRRATASGSRPRPSSRST